MDDEKKGEEGESVATWPGHSEYCIELVNYYTVLIISGKGSEGQYYEWPGREEEKRI